MAAWLDVCRFSPTLGGTTDWTYSAAVQGYQSPVAAGAVNGTVYRYRAESADLLQWEIGFGTYNTGTNTLARTTVLYNSAGTTAKINFTVAPQVAVVALKEDLISIEEANSFTTAQKLQARSNVAAIGKIVTQVFPASGTYTPTAGMLYCIIEGVGSGGGGGAATDSGAGGMSLSGGGGGSGSYSRLTASAATIGVSQAVTIGPAGVGALASDGTNGSDCSLGALLIAKGGGGAKRAFTSQLGAGGLGGIAGTGDIAAAGVPGNDGFYNVSRGTVSAIGNSGNGGSSFFGGGAVLQTLTGAVSQNGVNAGPYGSGGSGALIDSTASASAKGGDGSKGLIVVTEYCS